MKTDFGTMGEATPAPVAAFVYNRVMHTRRMIEALAANAGASETELFVFSDASKNSSSEADVAEVRTYIRQATGFRKVTMVEREVNWGLAKSIIAGVTQLCQDYGRVIVLEDDLVTSPYFLQYMNAALDVYANVDEVASISGYMYPVTLSPPHQTFMWHVPQSWGWATWARAWKQFEADGEFLLSELTKQRRISGFDENGPHSYRKMLEAQIAGRNDSWYIRWHASTFLQNRLHLMPGRSLVRNIGIDGTGVHCAEWRYDPFDVEVSCDPVMVRLLPAMVEADIPPIIGRYCRKVKLLRYVNFFLRLPLVRHFIR
jgi:hypothetical protein